MTGQRILIRELLKIRDAVLQAKNTMVIEDLVDKAINLALPVEPNMMNADILGIARILESKQRIIELIQKEKDWSNTGMGLNDIKFQTVASLVMLMNKFVASSELEELNNQA